MTGKHQQGKNNRRKGAAIERQIVAQVQDAGIACEKVSRTGHAGHDITVADTYQYEVKSRKDGGGFKILTRWLGDNAGLILREGGQTQPAAVVLQWEHWVELMKG